MKHAVPAFFAALLAPTVALACPGACSTCTSFGSYVSTISIGVLIGVASVGVENMLRRRR
ncbi:MAG TPA: hypothetical protein VGH28_14900 [Polyangiaceae bacterium]|jgi:hypothetical protein